MSVTQEQLRNEVTRFINADDIATNREYMDFFITCFHDLILKHRINEEDSYEKEDAKMILQMMFSKFIHLRKFLEGVTFLSKEGKQIIKPFIDPTILISLVRNIYEMVCLFNIVYDATDSDEKSNIVYSLWRSSGLKYRQRFSEIATTEENKKKVKEEQEEIENIKHQIEATEYYKNLDEKNQKKIQTILKEKDYKVKLEDDEVRFLSWQQISEEFISKSNIFKDMYTYFSLYAHPSHVSVFQFADMFRVEKEDFKGITVFNLRFCFAMGSIFLGDLIRLFPEMKATFEGLSEKEQILLNFYNRMLRDDDKSINEAWKLLG